MEIHRIIGILAIAAVAALSSCGSQPGVKQDYVLGRGDQAIANLIFNDVNAYRRSKGSRDLQRHPGLERLAIAHCEYLRHHRGEFDLHWKVISHVGAEGRSLAAVRNMKMLNTGENVASIMKDATDARTSRSIVSAWENSKNHEFGMRSDAWTHTGIGVLVDPDGRVIVTQLFGILSLSHLDNRDRFIRF